MPEIDWNMPWSSANVVAIFVSLLLFCIGWLLGRGQRRILSGITELQSAIAELEIREKLGCVRNNLGVVADVPIDNLPSLSDHRRSEVIRYSNLVVADSRAVFPILHFASAELQTEFIDAIDSAFKVLSRLGYHDQVLDFNRHAEEYVGRLEDKGHRELATRLRAA